MSAWSSSMCLLYSCNDSQIASYSASKNAVEETHQSMIYRLSRFTEEINQYSMAKLLIMGEICGNFLQKATT